MSECVLELIRFSCKEKAFGFRSNRDADQAITPSRLGTAFTLLPADTRTIIYESTK